MKFTTATIWHKTGNNTYSKIICSRSFVCPSKKANVNGTDITPYNTLTVRCFSYSHFSVYPGDRICCNLALSKNPPADSLIIKEVKEQLINFEKP